MTTSSHGNNWGGPMAQGWAVMSTATQNVGMIFNGIQVRRLIEKVCYTALGYTGLSCTAMQWEGYPKGTDIKTS